MKKLVTIFLLSALCALGQTAKNRASLYSEIDTRFPDNNNHTITAGDLRYITKNVVASSANALTDGAVLVASGSYPDPAWLPSLSYAKLTGKPTFAAVATTGAYSSLTGRPTLAAVATTGAYSSLTGRPTLASVATSGLYSDLLSKPSLAGVATSGSAGDLNAGVLAPDRLGAGAALQVLRRNAANDALEFATISAGGGDMTRATYDTNADNVVDLAATANSIAYANVTGKPALADIALTGAYTDLVGKPTFAAVALTGAYGDLSGKPSLSTVAGTGSYTDLINRPAFATVATTGSYADLTDKPTASGSGDMLKATYDVNADNLVDVAASANAVAYANVSGKPAYLATDATNASNISSGTLAADRLGAGTAFQVLRRNAANTALEFVSTSVGSGDMERLVYDTNNDNIVDTAAVANSVAYANVTGKPALLTNPMTAFGDVIVGGTAGAVTRYAGGQSLIERAARTMNTGLTTMSGNLITGTNLTVENPRQRDMRSRKFGIFVHYGINTFNEAEWSDGSLSASTYNPTRLDPDQWVRTAKQAGAKYILLVTKHHDGFAMWPTAQSTYGVMSSPVKRDVVGEVAMACKRYGLGLGLYYSLWDRKQNSDTGSQGADAAYTVFLKNQLTELLTNYGEICELWLDGGWEKLPARWDIPGIYDLARRLQPRIVVTVNWTVGDPLTQTGGPNPDAQTAGMSLKYFPVDFRTRDPLFQKQGSATANDRDPKTFVSGGKTYYLPFEATFTMSGATPGKWFWNTNTDADLLPAAAIVEKFYKSSGQQNSIIINISPGTTGQLSAAVTNRLLEVAELLKIGPDSELEDLAEQMPTTTSSSLTQVNYAGQYSGLDATDGLLGTRWAANTGDVNGAWVEVDLQHTARIDRVMVHEYWPVDAGGSGQGTIRSYQVQGYRNGSWTVLTSGTSDGTQLRYAALAFPPTVVSKVRFTALTATAEPSLYNFSVYGTMNNPAVTNLATKDRISVTFDGGGASLAAGARSVTVAPYPLTITGWKLVSPQNGSLTVDVRKGVSPAATTTVVGSSGPTLTGAYTNSGSDMTGWSTRFEEGDVIDCVVTGTPSVQSATLLLNVLR